MLDLPGLGHAFSLLEYGTRQDCHRKPPIIFVNRNIKISHCEAGPLLVLLHATREYVDSRLAVPFAADDSKTCVITRCPEGSTSLDLALWACVLQCRDRGVGTFVVEASKGIYDGSLPLNDLVFNRLSRY